ncbi:MAG: VTT domain-containing protein [Candidatus Andersenbacteria bacterium]|nr:VTT domain-containing protein [Candidatus Andersenbacteria bacterium]MBI3250634.1 VTT domain-containing protein [Candidatus Andersenbacteria bacterium]
MIDIPTIEQLFILHYVSAVFIGSFFFGESVIITAAYLAAQLSWDMPRIFAAAFVGTVLADIGWFLAGGFLREKFSRLKRWQKQRQKVSTLLEKLVGQRPFIALLFVKFLYGSRTAMILYLAARRVSLPAFIFFDCLGTIIWLIVILPLGYLAAKGTADALPSLNVLQVAIFVLVISGVVYRFISLWITKKVTKQP